MRKAEKYKKQLKKYCNKHFAHIDIQSPEDNEKDYVGLSILMSEYIELINNAKIILTIMCKVCQKPPCDFSENSYKSYTKQFWGIINFTEMNVSNRR